MSSRLGSEASPCFCILFPQTLQLIQQLPEPASTLPDKIDGSSIFYEAIKLLSRSPSEAVVLLVNDFLSPVCS